MIRLLVFTLLYSVSAFAAEFQLYKENGKAVRDYDNKVKELLQYYNESSNEPALLKFGNDVQFKATYLDMGGQNIILDIGDDKVLRIRKRKRRIFSFWAQFSPEAGAILADNLGDYEAAHRILSDRGVPVPELFESRDNQYIVLEKIKFEFDYTEYLEESKKGNINKAANKALIEFSKITAGFHDIGDFRGPQLVFNSERGWILIDFSKEYSMASSKADGNIFQMDRKDQIMNQANMQGMTLQPLSIKPGLPAHLEAQVLAAIEASRSCDILLSN